MQYDVLIIDDEVILGQATAEYFSMFDVKTFYAETGGQAFDFLANNQVSLILLDINLRNESGFDLCKKLRQNINIPILFISARISENDMLMALNIGGDDYITKPYTLSVLLAKVKARLKRREPENTGKILSIGNITLDYEKFKVYVSGKDTELKTMEFKLLNYLVSNINKVVPKEELFREVWHEDYFSDGTLNVHIRRLREKIEENPNEPNYIKTVWGVGYVFENK